MPLSCSLLSLLYLTLSQRIESLYNILLLSALHTTLSYSSLAHQPMHLYSDVTQVMPSYSRQSSAPYPASGNSCSIQVLVELPHYSTHDSSSINPGGEIKNRYGCDSDTHSTTIPFQQGMKNSYHKDSSTKPSRRLANVIPPCCGSEPSKETPAYIRRIFGKTSVRIQFTFPFLYN